MMRRRLFAVLLGTLLIAAACGGDEEGAANGEQAGEARRGGDLVFAQLAEHPHLEPAETYVNQALWAELQIMEPLFTPSEDGQEALPWLAEGFEISEDKLTTTIRLKDGIKFSDGSDMTSADVKFSLEQASKSEAWGFINFPLAEGEIQAPDDLTVVIRTKQPWAPLIPTLALFSNAIVPQNYNDMSHDEFFEKPIGTGPFMIEQWTKGESLELVRNPNYWQEGKPYLDSVTFLAVPDDNARLNMLRGGQADIIEAPPFSVLDSLDKEQGITAKAFPSSKTDLLYLNTKVEPFDDQNVRQAVAYAIDRQAIVEAVLFGHGEPANSFIAPAVASYNPDNEAPQYDPEMSKELLSKSSEPNGFRTTLLIPSSSDARTMAQIMQSNLKDVGIDVEIVTQDPNTAFGNLTEGNYEMMAFAWTTDIPHADELIGGYADVDGQWTGLVHPESRKAIDEARRTFNQARTDELYAQVQRQVAIDSSVIALFYSDYPYAYSDRVQGFEVLPTLNFHLEDVWLSE
jgi:peptide/nickel transport system substrate-binding protein